MRPDDTQSIVEEQPAPGWHWRNCRSLGVGVRFWLWPWIFGAGRDDDLWGGYRWIHLGPIEASIHYSIGNSSDESWWGRAGALSEVEAWQRAVRAMDRATKPRSREK